MKEGAWAVKDTAKDAWSKGTAKAGDVFFGGKGWSKKNDGNDYYGGEDWSSYGYGGSSEYGHWPDEDSYGGAYDWPADKEWQRGSKWEGDYYY